MYNIILISAIHPSGSVIHMYILFQILFHYRYLQVEYSSLCFIAGPFWLYILHTIMHICSSQVHNLALSLHFPLQKP